ncbi:hypothetical protein UWK_01117 [Desulfocapsa sulfexigens DSM 10523]|uniref:DoxX protein n=1 Tax=Desulfocapsa sulfexigens (strain DSM 10523 / SB164P1) TaxID=1167006 RepID=M1PD46_DESSD|nr:hypothetical protein [Desulfocapsa sulfexigens]AGF77685.1 hypothetical protein UWK_01117 [Desulfocapsa sulfexigens DSM 10523]
MSPYMALIDRKISAWMDKYCQGLMRISLALIFIWFGMLKPLGMSPEEELIKNTVYFFPPEVVLFVLGCWEVTIGIGLLYKPLLRVALLLLLIELPGTFLPLIVLPEICFHSVPFGLSLEGQYIVKNLFLIGAAFVIGSKVAQNNPLLEETEA